MRYGRLALSAVLLVLPAAAWAQSRVTGADVQGTVQDQSHAAAPGATVTITNVDTNLVRTTVSDAGGRYFFGALPPGTYRINVELQGFVPQTVKEVVVLLGQSVEQPFVLRVAGGAETVTVVETAAVADARRTAVSFSVGQQQIDGLPINGRSFINFAALTPGVTTDRTTARGIISTSGLSFTGQAARSNSVTVDGFDNNDVTNGGVRGLFSQEAIREFQVLTDSYSAEFGRASGGVINIVTKGGNNELHGNAFFYFRDDRFNAKAHFERFDPFGNEINQQKAPYDQKQYGGTLSGPIRKDKTFFFFSYERSDVTNSNFVNIDPLVAAALSRQGFPVELGYVPYRVDSSQALLKIDHQWSVDDSIALRASFSDTDNGNAEQFGGLNARSNGGLLSGEDWFISAAQTDILSPRWINETRVLASRAKQSIVALDPRCNGPCDGNLDGGPQVTILGAAMVGRVATAPQYREGDRLEATQTLSYFGGSHLLKFGGTFAYLKQKQLTLPLNMGGAFVFAQLPGAVVGQAAPLSALEALERGLPVYYTRGYGDPSDPFTYKDFALFVQDEWRASKRLTLKPGVRYQRQIFPETTYNVSSLNGTRFEYVLPQDKDDIAPRLGASYDLTGDGRTTLHAAYGLFYDDQIAGNLSTTTILDGRSHIRGLALRLPQSAAAWRAPNHQFPEPAAPFVSSVFVFDPGLQTPYAHQASLGVERLLGSNVLFSVNGIYLRGKNQLSALDLNPVIPSLGPGRRPNDVNGVAGTSATITQFSSYGNSWYKAMVVSLAKQYSGRSQFQISYTLSKAEDTADDFFSTPQDGGFGRNPADPKGLPLGLDPLAERGPSINGQRHRLVVSGLYQFPWGVNASTIVTYGSGRPFTPVAGVDLNGSADAQTTPPDRARRNPADPRSAVARNSETTASQFTVDLRLAKRLSFGSKAALELIAEAFNLFNRVNYTDINNIFGTGAFPDRPQRDLQGRVTYGTYVRAAPPRQVQLAAKVSF